MASAAEVQDGATETVAAMAGDEDVLAAGRGYDPPAAATLGG